MRRIITNRTKSILRKLVCDKWRNGEITSKVMYEKTHEFHEGPARDIYYRYTRLPEKQLVAQALVGGILSSSKVPDDLLKYLANTIDLLKQLEKLN